MAQNISTNAVKVPVDLQIGVPQDTQTQTLEIAVPNPVGVLSGTLKMLGTVTGSAFQKSHLRRRSSRVMFLHGLFTYNFVTLLYVYDSLMPDISKQKRYDQLKEFMETRVIRNKDYFVSNSKITSVYNFLKKVIDNLQARAYNISTIEK